MLVAQNVHVNNRNVNVLSYPENSIPYLSRVFTQPFPTNNFKYVSSKEIENIKKSL